VKLLQRGNDSVVPGQFGHRFHAVPLADAMIDRLPDGINEPGVVPFVL